MKFDLDLANPYQMPPRWSTVATRLENEECIGLLTVVALTITVYTIGATLGFY